MHIGDKSKTLADAAISTRKSRPLVLDADSFHDAHEDLSSPKNARGRVVDGIHGQLDVLQLRASTQSDYSIYRADGPTELEQQTLLLKGVNEMAARIEASYPAERYQHVGLGRSPTSIIAALQNDGSPALNIPLSSFRPANGKSSITDAWLGAKRIDPEQQARLFQHFETCFPQHPARDRVLLVDYTQTGRSLLAAQEQLREFFQFKNWKTEVHALAMCRSGVDTSQMKGLGAMLAKSQWGDWLRGQKDARAAFERCWHVMSMDGATPEQRALEKSMSTQSFDDYAPYGSYKVLETADKPVYFSGSPDAPTAYDVVKDELANVKAQYKPMLSPR